MASKSMKMLMEETPEYYPELPVPIELPKNLDEVRANKEKGKGSKNKKARKLQARACAAKKMLGA